MYPYPPSSMHSPYKSEAHPAFDDDKLIAAEASCQSQTCSCCNTLPSADVSPASSISFVVPSPREVSPLSSKSFCIPGTLRLPLQPSLQSIRPERILQGDISPASSEPLSMHDTLRVDLPVITVITLNVFGNMGKHLQSRLDQLSREEPLADFICLQEAPIHNKK